MHIVKALAVTALLSASPALADEEVVYSNDLVTECVSLAGTEADMRVCAGVSAEACQNASDYGSTTIGLQECAALETKFWDEWLNRTYRELLARAKAADAEAENDPRANGELAESLRDMQRIWINFRDATCEYEANQYQGGTIAGPVYAGCLLQMTADQAIYLDNSWPTY
ncbi:lysozyme inhibitor LprI family protein [Martelella sp. AD-3]|uniref:lysozyme inhibitor LprI family protein n=1 Tax=Martelella sp. AD-3 TaxID=686597 RepID=UPI0004B64D6C|nr:lysozyme inhibitor LprI family protein [Martelella sp. AD-3]AMM83570.1 hypothetical protein AZF01_03695 [Martelella sp. AD-3]